MNIVENARELAIKYHRGQMYGKFPYVCHLREVVDSLEDKYGKGVDPVLIAVSWLHDSLEDTEISPHEIVKLCGQDVYDAVEAVSKWVGQTYEGYIAAVRSNPIALEVKRHDTLCNLTASIMSGENGRIRKYARQMLLLSGEE